MEYIFYIFASQAGTYLINLAVDISLQDSDSIGRYIAQLNC